MSDPDPLDLPMFGSEPRSGRVRSTFSYGDDAGSDAAAQLGSASTPSRPGEPTRLHMVPAGTQSVPSVTSRPTRAISSSPQSDLDWAVVAQFRQQVADRLADQQGEGGGADSVQQERDGWAIIRQVLDEDDADRVITAGEARTVAERELLSQAIFDSVFRLGRLQPLVDDLAVENIMITGFDQVVVERSDGTLHQVGPVADSDDDLARFLEYLAGRADNPRTFTPSQPSLHMTLPGGARLAAARDTARISVVIRRHRVREVTLADLVEWGSITSTIASFLAAAVKARLSIVIAGGQGDGKTTMLRALCAEIDPMEVVGTFESEYELFLHEMREQHPIVHAWEQRGGSGEAGLGGRAAGSRTTSEQIIDSFRFRLDRQILGEIRGPEVWSMVKLMESGSGSLSTTHAASAQKAMQKLISCAMEAGPQISPQVAATKLSQTVDLVVQLACDVVRDPKDPSKARKKRYVEEIVQVLPGERETGYATNVIFRRMPGGCAVANTRPDDLMDALVAHGLDRLRFESEMATNIVQGRLS